MGLRADNGDAAHYSDARTLWAPSRKGPEGLKGAYVSALWAEVCRDAMRVVKEASGDELRWRR